MKKKELKARVAYLESQLGGIKEILKDASKAPASRIFDRLKEVCSQTPTIQEWEYAKLARMLKSDLMDIAVEDFEIEFEKETSRDDIILAILDAQVKR